MTLYIKQTTLTPELKKHIYASLGQHAILSTGIDGLASEPVVFTIRENDQLAALVAVQMFWGQLHIKYLLVEESYRGQGYGKNLMEHAFDFAKKQNCHFAFVETMSFQAPEFYQKLGFKIDFVRHGYDKATSFYYLTKDL
jgi:ribosomal protein S18 acetylase RimI-like enzyme